MRNHEPLPMRERLRAAAIRAFFLPVLLMLTLGPAAVAQSEEQQANEEGQDATEEEQEEGLVEKVTVTGTRVKGRVATETPAPVDFIDEETIESTGATETGKVLQLTAPSVNFSSTTISDGTDIIRPATLRALAPDQVLVLVNGKRRHQQALVNVQQTIARGSAGYDLNAIPVSAIDHIEVLRDGAAAQYGSDAIAGVINIILKNQSEATDFTVDWGQHYEGDGEVLRGAINTGFPVLGEGFVNLTLEYRDRSETNRAGLATTNALGWYEQSDFDAGVREVKLRIGDAESENFAFWLNSSIPAGPGRFYAFGGYSDRKGNSSGFFRGPNDNRTVPDFYPEGFLPTIITEPTDMSLVLGYAGGLGHGWSYDVSANYGKNEFQFREENTVNVTYFFEPLDPLDPMGPRFEESPTQADTGRLEFDQTALNLDFTGKVDWGVGQGPLYVAAGAEWRQDGYKIVAGDEVSYEYGRTDDRSIQIFGQTGEIAQPGTQGFPGWSPREAIDDSRENVGVYVDLESELTPKFLLGAAVRYEDYSDFGNTAIGKLSARFKFTPSFSLRGTASTGFRAPGVQQAFYSQRSTNLNAAGVLTDTLTALQGGAVTQAFGIPPLEEETSVNYSLGLVTKVSRRFRLTLDLYRIDIDDRIVFSSNIQPEDPAGCVAPGDCPIRDILDPFGVGQVLFFTNAIDTETTGLDIVALYDWHFANGSSFLLEGAFHFNDTEVTARRSSSSILPPEVLFDDAQVTLIEEGQPSEHFVVAGTYRWGGGFAANLRVNYFGEVAGEGFTPGFKQTWGAKALTDLAVTVPLMHNLSLAFGGTNVFDEFPDEWDQVQAFPFPQLGFVYGWETLPFGVNGGYYYTRLSYRLDHRRR